jgi:hypothetical protein
VSAFRGAEPDERRWNIETPRLDSWSMRASWTPTPSWAFQASYEIDQPEALHRRQDERRVTASAHYSQRGMSAMLVLSSKDRPPGGTFAAWLAEASCDIDRGNSLFGRLENVANDEFFPDHTHPLHDRPFRVSKFQVGYARRLPTRPFELALGGSANAHVKPDALDAPYGADPLVLHAVRPTRARPLRRAQPWQVSLPAD